MLYQPCVNQSLPNGTSGVRDVALTVAAGRWSNVLQETLDDLPLSQLAPNLVDIATGLVLPSCLRRRVLPQRPQVNGILYVGEHDW